MRTLLALLCLAGLTVAEEPAVKANRPIVAMIEERVASGDLPLETAVEMFRRHLEGGTPIEMGLFDEEFVKENDAAAVRDRVVLRSRHVDTRSHEARAAAGLILALTESLPEYPNGGRLLFWETLTPIDSDTVLVSGKIDTAAGRGRLERVTVGLDRAGPSAPWVGVFVRRGGRNYFPAVSSQKKRVEAILATARQSEAGREILETH